MAEVALADDHPGHERAQRRGEAGQARDPSRAERQQQHRQEEELRRLVPGDPSQSAAEQRPADHRGGRQRKAAERHLPGDRHGLQVAGAGIGADHH